MDTGIFFEVMYYDLVKQLNLTKDNLKPAQAPLVGFNALSHWSLGTVSYDSSWFQRADDRVCRC